MTGAALQRRILEHFGQKPWIRLFVRSTGLFMTMQGRRIIIGTPGEADLWAMLRGGQHVEIEVKGDRDRQLKTQKRWEAMCKHMGVTYILARSIDDVYDGLSDAGLLPEEE